MQVAPATTTSPDAWVADAALDRSNRDRIIAGLLDPGPYLQSENDKVSDGLRLIDKLTIGAAEHGITFTKHKTHTPLQEAFMCHDKVLHISYGKVACTVRGASPLDVAAFLADYDSNFYKKHSKNPSLVKYSVLECVNSHHWVFYYQTTSPPPLQNRDLVWSFIVKRLSDDQYVCVLLPTLHAEAPVTADVVRAESTRIYRITKISESATKLELFLTVDLKGSIPSLITRNIVIPTSLTVKEPIYFMQIKEYDEYDRAGDDAKMLGQLLMDETRSLVGAVRDAAIGTFFSRTAALRHLSGKHPWLEVMVITIVENKIRRTTRKSSAVEGSALSSSPHGVVNTSDAPGPLEAALTVSSHSIPSQKSGVVTALNAIKIKVVSSMSRVNSHTLLHAVTPDYAIIMGRSFALTLLSSTTPEGAVDEWIVKYPALVELDMAEPTVFRPFVTCIAKNLLERSSFGSKLRVVIGAVISVLDMVSDIVMIFQFIQNKQMRAASATISFIILNMLVQVLMVYLQTKRKPRRVFFFEVLIVFSCLKPGVDAARVLGGEKDPLLTVPVMYEMVISKAVELAIEAVPGSILQCFILITSPKKSTFAIFSLCMSALSASYTATTIFFDFDTDVAQRRRNPSLWGAIPDTGRGSVFALMVLISAFQMLAKVLSIALLASSSAVGLTVWLLLDMVVYLAYKLVRNDFVYFVPGTTGAMKYILAFVTRVLVKITVDFTGLLNGRAPTEMGGVYYSFDMIVSQLSCWVVASLYIAHQNTNDIVALDRSGIYMFIGGLHVCWGIAVVLCLSKIKRKYLRTFYSTETAPGHLFLRFLNGNDEQKMNVIASHADLWAHFKDELKAFSLANWIQWEEARPAWFNENLKAIVPDDFIPKASLDALNKNHGGKRRRSSIGGLALEESERGGKAQSSSSTSLQVREEK